MRLKEFKVNNLITLRMENDRTNIYIKGRLFRQCKFLLLNKLYLGEIKDYVEDFRSVDEEIEDFAQSLEQGINNDISPKTEFWAHCSNLQVWVENDYDTRLLHRNLAFPLLKKLSEDGDVLAENKFKEEIFKRLERGTPSVIQYLLENGFIKYLNREEFFNSILILGDFEILMELEQLSPYNYHFLQSFEFLQNQDTDLCVFFTINKRQIQEIQFFFEVKGPLTFPSPLAKLRNLKTLHILINEFVDNLPEPKEIINSLRELRILSWGNTTLPDSFGKFPNLERLEIYGGIFERVPESIGTLKKLKRLSLIRTEISYLPKSIENLESLEFLNLSYCDLINLPKTIIKLKKIKKLKMNSKLLNKYIEKWIKSLDLVQTDVLTTSKNKYLIMEKKLID